MIESSSQLKPGTWFRYDHPSTFSHLFEHVYKVTSYPKIEKDIDAGLLVDVIRCPDGESSKFACSQFELPYYQILCEDEAAMLILGKVG